MDADSAARRVAATGHDHPATSPGCQPARREANEDPNDLHRDEDREQAARRAIEYLTDHNLVFNWGFAADNLPSETVRNLIAGYFIDGEIATTLSQLVVRYLMKSLAEEYLRIGTYEPEAGDSFRSDSGLLQGHA